MFIYFFLILRASAADMRQAAVNSGLAGGPQGGTTNDRAGIINNAQPFSFTGAVGTDSNVWWNGGLALKQTFWHSSIM